MNTFVKQNFYFALDPILFYRIFFLDSLCFYPNLHHPQEPV